MCATIAGLLVTRTLYLAAYCALYLGSTGLAWSATVPNELGNPIVREFPPGGAGIGYFCPAVTQDAAGYIYISSGTGVRFYDGAKWQIVPLPTESAGVRKFAVTADGTIYAGGASVIGFLRGTAGARQYISLADRLPLA